LEDFAKVSEAAKCDSNLDVPVSSKGGG